MTANIRFSLHVDILLRVFKLFQYLVPCKK